MDLEREMERLAKMRREVQSAHKQLDELEIEVAAPDRSVVVTVTANGQISNFKISDHAFDNYTREELERGLLAATKAAQRAAAETTQRVVARLVPGVVLSKLRQFGGASH